MVEGFVIYNYIKTEVVVMWWYGGVCLSAVMNINEVTKLGPPLGRSQSPAVD